MTPRAALAAALMLAAAVPLAAFVEVTAVHRNPNDVAELAVKEDKLVATTSSGSRWEAGTHQLRLALRRPDHTPVVRDAEAEGPEAPAPTAPGRVGAPFFETVGGYPVTAVGRVHGRLFLATFGAGLFGRDGTPLQGSPREVRALAELPGILVVGSSEGIALTDGRTVRRIRLQGPPHDDVSSLAWDGASLWVGYFDGGLARMRDGAWEMVPTPGPPGASWINSVCWDGEALWVGSMAGLGRWDAASGAVVAVEGFEGQVASVRNDGGVLVVAGAHRAWVRGEGEWERLDFPDDQLQTALVSEDSFWAGGLRGLLRREGGRWRRYSRFNGKLPESWITAVLPSGDGLWVGTYDGGLLRVGRDGSARKLRGDVWVNPNAIARAGAITAVGTMGDGLLLHDRATGGWRRLTRAEGLPSDDVTAALPVGRTLWVGTRAGLAELALR